MKVKNVKINYLLNISRFILTGGIWLITMPYVNRILGSSYIGKVEYTNALLNYFILFSALGIPTYGIREIAKVKNDPIKRTKVFFELFTILTVSTILIYFILYFLIFPLNVFPDIKYLLLIMSIRIFLYNMGTEWFYQGIEDQWYITIRHIIVKLLTIIFLLCFVHTQDDYIIYGAILIFSLYGGNVFNFFHLKKYITLKNFNWRSLEIKKYFKPISVVFLSTISISIYTQINIIILKFYSGIQAVGYFSQADKLPKVALLFITSLGAVMLPRLTHLFENNNHEEYKKYVTKSLNFILFFTLPISMLFIIYSEELILLMAGNDFLPAIPTLKISSINILMMGLTYFLGFQILYPIGKEKIYMIAVSIVAIISLIINFLIIPKWSYNGAAVASVISECIGITIILYFLRSQLTKQRINSIISTNYIYFIAVLLLLIVSYIISFLHLSPFLDMIIGGGIGMTIYLLFLYFMKEKIIREISSKFFNPLNKR